MKMCRKRNPHATLVEIVLVLNIFQLLSETDLEKYEI